MRLVKTISKINTFYVNFLFVVDTFDWVERASFAGIKQLN